jgi:uncharacterized protein related to proFAR isomerase
VPLDFDSIEDLKVFQRSIGAHKGDEPAGFIHIPIVPVDTTTLFRVPYIDLPIAQVAEVVEVEWNDGFDIVGHRERFSRYWGAVSGPRYSAKDIMVLDLSGVQAGRPNFDVLKALIKSKYHVWLDLGVRDIEDVFDSFAMDVNRTIIGTMTAPSLDVFEEAFDLSDRVVPCVHYDGGVLWPGRRPGPRDVKEAVAAMADIGFDRIGVLDLGRIGRKQGVDMALVELLAELDGNIIFGGGVTEQEVSTPRSAGLSGVFIDPFTPVIDQLVIEAERELPTKDVVPTTRPAPRGAGLPSE